MPRLLLCALFVFACRPTSRTYVPLDGVALGGDSFASGSGNEGSEGGDNPVIVLSQPPARMRGGVVWEASYTITSRRELAAAQLQFAADGDLVDAFTTDIAAGEHTVRWQLPKLDVPGARFRLIAVDVEGHFGQIVSSPFAIDSTGPAVPDYTLAGPALTNQRMLTLQIPSCGDAAGILFGELASLDDTVPEYLWQSCAAVPGPSFPLSGADGERTVHVWARDDVGNPSLTAKSSTVTLDTTPPVVTLVSPQDGATLGPQDQIVWTASDLHAQDGRTTVQISTDGGATFTDIATAQPFSGAWLPLNFPSGSYRVRVTTIDAAGNSGSATSGNDVFSDRTPPGAPQVSLSSPAITNDPAVTLAVASCAERPFVHVSETMTAPAATDPAWQACAASLPFSLAAIDGTHTISVWAKDAAGNVSTMAAVLNVALDRQAPVLAFVQPLDGDAVKANATYSVQWTATDAYFDATPVVLEVSYDGGAVYSTLTNSGAPNSSFNWPVPNAAAANVRLRLTATDRATNVTSVVIALLVAKAQPTFSVLRLNGELQAACAANAAETTNPFALVELQATDPDGAKLTHVCFKTIGSTTPLATDPCFQSVAAPPINATPATTLNLVDVPVRLGFVTATVTVRAWVKNAAGIVSGYVDSECVQRRTIFFNPGDPPVVSNVTAFTTDAPADPYTETDATLDGAHPDAFVKWNVVLPNGAATGPTGPITLEYTTDDFVYTEIPGAFANTGDTGCTVTAGYTGCHVWAAPPAIQGGYVKVRVRATDRKGVASVSSSVPPLDVPPLRFLAGNPDPGYGGNAASTLFVNHLTQPQFEPKQGTLAVSSRGVIYFLDPRYGIMWVDPATGNTDTLVRINGLPTPINGPVKQSTARQVYRITMDHDDNLLFWDYDRIRRINVNADKLPTGTATVSTLIGGGSDTDTLGDDQHPLNDVRVYSGPGVSLWAVPNGDIYFTSSYNTTPATSFAVRHYVKARNRVDTIPLTGNGWWSMYYPASQLDDPAAAVANANFLNLWLAYDLQTSLVQRMFSFVYNHPSYGYGVATFDADGSTHLPPALPSIAWMNLNAEWQAFTGMDGHLYVMDQISNLGVYRYEVATNTWTLVLGGGPSVTNICTDSPPPDAQSCRTNFQDVFVDAAGHLYWLSYGKIYTLTEDNKMLRIMGQGYDFGDDGPPLAARFGSLRSFDYWRDTPGRDRIVTADSLSIRYREVILANGLSVDAQDNTVQHLAGNGDYGYVGDYYGWRWDGTNVSVTNGPDARTIRAPLTSQVTVSVDRTNGFVYPALGYYTSLDYSTSLGRSFLTRLRRDVGGPPQWEAFAGGGSIGYSGATDGTRGRDLSFANVYSARSYGVHDGRAVYQLTNLVNGTYPDAMILEFAVNPPGPTGLTGPETPTGSNGPTGMPGPSGGAITRFLGAPNQAMAPACADGSDRLNCTYSIGYSGAYTPAIYDPGDGDTNARWIVAADWNHSLIRGVDVAPGGQIHNLVSLPVSTRSFTFRRTATKAYIYYCDPSAGRLYRMQIEPTVQGAVALPWPVPTRGAAFTLQCRGTAMRYDPDRLWTAGKLGTILLAYEQNGLYGVAEYYDEPPP